jgi:arylsulfatase A-like enzyme
MKLRIAIVTTFLGTLWASNLGAQTNTLLIVADDVGVDAISAYKEGTAPPPTPTIDALAKNGILFRNAYANPICSPTRATLHTGRYCARTGVGAVVSYGLGAPLSLEEYTLPELLKQKGFGTSLIGKWHLGDARNGGDNGPNLAGWSHYAGHMWNFKAPETYFSWRKVTNGKVTTSKVYATTDNVNDALGWIQTQTTNKKPWVCCICFNAAHGPFHVPPNTLHTYNITNTSPVPLKFKAMVQAIDTEIGRLLTALPAAVLAKTNVIFVGDNGTPPGASEAPFTGAHAKTTLYEGGTNVPLIIAGPAVVSPGREEKGLVASVDLFPTVLELAGIDPRTTVPRSIPLDGISLLPYLKKTNNGSLRQTIYTERFGSKLSVARKDGAAIRNQTYKLIRWTTPVHEQFFNLAVDGFEKVNLLARALNATERANYNALAAELSRLRADYFPFGAGCSGKLPTAPRLELLNDGLPRVGSTFVTLVAGASANAPVAVGCLGVAKQDIDLIVLGMPGCKLLVSLDHLSVFPIQSGYGVWLLPIPNLASLVGATVYQQAIVVEPLANQQNLIMSHGARVTVGGK